MLFWLYIIPKHLGGSIASFSCSYGSFVPAFLAILKKKRASAPLYRMVVGKSAPPLGFQVITFHAHTIVVLVTMHVFDADLALPLHVQTRNVRLPSKLAAVNA